MRENRKSTIGSLDGSLNGSLGSLGSGGVLALMICAGANPAVSFAQQPKLNQANRSRYEACYGKITRFMNAEETKAPYSLYLDGRPEQDWVYKGPIVLLRRESNQDQAVIFGKDRVQTVALPATQADPKWDETLKTTTCDYQQKIDIIADGKPYRIAKRRIVRFDGKVENCETDPSKGEVTDQLRVSAISEVSRTFVQPQLVTISEPEAVALIRADLLSRVPVLTERYDEIQEFCANLLSVNRTCLGIPKEMTGKVWENKDFLAALQSCSIEGDPELTSVAKATAQEIAVRPEIKTVEFPGSEASEAPSSAQAIASKCEAKMGESQKILSKIYAQIDAAVPGDEASALSALRRFVATYQADHQIFGLMESRRFPYTLPPKDATPKDLKEVFLKSDQVKKLRSRLVFHAQSVLPSFFPGLTSCQADQPEDDATRQQALFDSDFTITCKQGLDVVEVIFRPFYSKVWIEVTRDRGEKIPLKQVRMFGPVKLPDELIFSAHTRSEMIFYKNRREISTHGGPSVRLRDGKWDHSVNHYSVSDARQRFERTVLIYSLPGYCNEWMTNHP